MSGFKGIAVAAVAAVSGSAAWADVPIGLVFLETGEYASPYQDQLQQASQLAVDDLNARGGILGEPVRIILGDDGCNAEQAVALANKFVSDGVVFVAGHLCSEASIPASQVYAGAGILMISPISTNPKLTEQGLRNVFRVVGRDDQQGLVAASYLAERYADQKIAIVHDGTVYVKGLADETKKALNRFGVAETLYEMVKPGMLDYSDLVEKIHAAGIDVVYFPGRDEEVGLTIRQARARGYRFPIITGDHNVTEAFRMIAGDATDGTLLTAYPDPRRNPEAADLLAKLRALQFPPDIPAFYAHATIQVWAQAVERAGTLELASVVKVLRSERFDTVLGRIGFDQKGDVEGYEPFVWYVWKGDTYVPIDPAAVAP
jgi:branched-chain amino acid transport system substrate-binding protein